MINNISTNIFRDIRKQVTDAIDNFFGYNTKQISDSNITYKHIV